jgi:hypothetical protein
MTNYCGFDSFEAYCNRNEEKITTVEFNIDNCNSKDDLIVKKCNFDDISCYAIDIRVFNIMYGYLTKYHPRFKEIEKETKLKLKKEEIAKDSDRVAKQKAREKELQEWEKERHKRVMEKARIAEIEIAKEKDKRERKEYKEDNEYYFTEFPDAKIERCQICNNLNIYPRDYINEETGESYKVKLEEKGELPRFVKACCSCYCIEESKKIKTELCKYCNKYITIVHSETHYATEKHKMNAKIYKQFPPSKYKYRLELLKTSKLYEILGNNKTKDGSCIIPSYSSLKRYDLLIRMYEVYDIINW